MSDNEIEEIKHWDRITISILVIAGTILIFSFIAPALFVGKAITPELDFSKTGPIGDTIGGIMNPFIALVGILLTFLAFYMQIKANQEQRRLFVKGLEAEKNKNEELERKDVLYKLELVANDLDSILSDIKEKGDKIKDFIDEERKGPYYANLLYRTVSKKYSRIADIDRLSVFKGFKLFLSEDDKWIKAFKSLYSTLDYLPSFFEEIYRVYDNEAQTKFLKKTEVTNKLLEFNKLGGQIINDYKSEFGQDIYLEQPASSIINEAMGSYQDIIQKNVDEQGNFTGETDFDDFSINMLLPFITAAMTQREDSETYDRRLEPLAQLASEIRKQIYLIKQSSKTFADNMEKQYQSLMSDKGEIKSTYTLMNDLKEFISNGVNKEK